jgi:hypothetical protein
MSDEEWDQAYRAGYGAAISALLTATERDLPGMEPTDVRLCISHLKAKRRDLIELAEHIGGVESAEPADEIVIEPLNPDVP